MAQHKFTRDDLSDLKEAVKLLKTVSNKIELDAVALEKIDDMIYPILDLIDEIEEAAKSAQGE